jgi:hypothetical protein
MTGKEKIQNQETSWCTKHTARNFEVMQLAYDYFKQQLNIIDDQIIDCKIVREDLGRGVCGNCSGHFMHNKLTKITIKVKEDLSLFSMLDTLAHEMVHATQYLNGRLNVKIKINWFLWLFPSLSHRTVFDKKDVTSLSYENRPHEQEAFEDSYKLVYRFNKFLAANKAI